MYRQDPTRRALFGRACFAGVALSAVAAAGARADGVKVPKETVKYQYVPHDADHCSECVYFLPGASPSGPGLCKAVEGPIPVNCWCVLFAHRK